MTTPSASQRILIVRNDKLGDFMLAYPAFALLKQSLPSSEVYALVPEYTREMAELCPWIDRVVIDHGNARDLGGIAVLSRQLRQLRLDAVITLFSTTRTGLAVLSAGIPTRIAPATKLAQIFYNQKLRQRRSRSEKPEYEYNLDLVRHFLQLQQCNAAYIEPPYLTFAPEETAKLKQDFCTTNNLDSSLPIIFIHPGHGGSASNISSQQYAKLALRLLGKNNVSVVISAGPGELQQAQQLVSMIGLQHSAIYHSTEGLKRFAQHIQFADVFISGSTGPLHIAGALNTPTAAFYPRRLSATALRWQTLNTPDRRLAFSPEAQAEENDMSSIDTDAVARTISENYL